MDIFDTFLIRTKGGPRPGSFVVTKEDGYDWPLPDKIYDDDGYYIKTSQSGITNEQAAKMDMTCIMRGAIYKWRPEPFTE